jgi:rhodanese-related sulfurtransferase
MAAERIDPMRARDHLELDSAAVLVCAYDSDDKFEENHLQGAISLNEFRARENMVAKDRELIFYCA